MTGIYNRTSKDWNLIFFVVIALLLHFVVLSIPVKKQVASRLCQAISVCVVPSKEPATLLPPAEQAAKPVLKSPVHPEPATPPEPKATSKAPPLPRAVIRSETDKKEIVAKQPQNVIKTGPPEIPSESKPRHEDDATLKGSGLEPGTPESETRKRDAFESASIAQGLGDDVSDLGPSSEVRDQGAMTYAMPKYKENPPPQYPRMAKRRGYEGRTVLEVEVFENGKVGDIVVAESSGFKILDEAAQDSVKEWSFVPGTRNGENIRQRVMVPVRFDLN